MLVMLNEKMVCEEIIEEYVDASGAYAFSPDDDKTKCVEIGQRITISKDQDDSTHSVYKVVGFLKNPETGKVTVRVELQEVL